jgi:DDE superfamily endonuclease
MGHASVSPDLVWHMEDVLDLDAEPYDRRRPQVCCDDSPVQVISETRQPLPAQPGQPARYDYEYRHAGTANLFLLVQPLRGWRHVNVTARRTKYDFALQKQELVDVHFPEAEVMRLVVDNLNTHTPAALDETCAPAEARRLTRKLELHYMTTSPASGVTTTVASRVCRRHKRLGYSPPTAGWKPGSLRTVWSSLLRQRHQSSGMLTGIRGTVQSFWEGDGRYRNPTQTLGGASRGGS